MTPQTPNNVPTGAAGEVRAAEKYAHIDFTPPEGVREAAARSLEVRAEKPESQRGMTPVGLARARDLAGGRTVSPETARRMLAYFTRHEQDKQGATWDEQGPGWQAWHAWGGDAGFAWARKLVAQLDAADEAEDMGGAQLAEASDYAVVGRPLRVLRLGALYDRRTGKPIRGVFRGADGQVIRDEDGRPVEGPPVVITDDDCAEMVRVFEHRRATGDGVPLDWNHYSRDEGPPELTGTFGEVVSLRHVPGDGLHAEMAYNARGERVVRDSTPALWTSPDFAVGPAFDKATGARIGGAELFSLALTPYPRQDRTDAVRLSENPADSRIGGNAMGDTQAPPVVVAGTPPAVQAAEPEDAAAMIAALTEENAKLKADLAAMMEKMAGYEEAEKAAGGAGASLSEVVRKVATFETKLSEERKARQSVEAKLAESEKARRSEKIAARLDGAERDGWYAPSPERRAYLVSLSERASDLFEAEMKRLSANPEVPLGEVGHSKAAPPAPVDPAAALHAQVVALCESRKWDITTKYSAALAAVRAGSVQ